MKELYDVVDAVLADSRSEDTVRNVLFGLAIHMDVRTFESRPGYARLTRYAGTSEKTVQRALRKLENELKEIALVGAGNGRRAQSYLILLGANRRSLHGVSTSETGQGGHEGGQKEVDRRSPKDCPPNVNRAEQEPPFPLSSEGGGQPEPVAPVLFDTILRRLALDVGNGFIARTMVEPLEQLGRRGDVLEVLAPDYCELNLTRRYGRRLTAIAREVLEDQAVDVRIVTASRHAAAQNGGRRR